ncbi:MAG: DUF4097 family beta strand repeat protein [Gemmatirosa sp.]|nr:DUF4097 family beta strand repeat protein [Gemmatirosa sp.]
MPTFPFRLAARAALLGGATLAAAATARAQATERHTLRGDAAVYNLAGTVRVVAGTGRDVVVEVARQGPDAAKLRVEQGEVRGRDAVRVVFPDDDVVYPAMGRGSRVRTRVNRDGTFGDGNGGFFSGGQVEVRSSGRGTEAWADVTVSVPAGARLAVHLVAGEATVSNVDGELSIDVHQASVSTERTRGRLDVDAGSGRVRIAGAQGDVNLDLGSGPVELRDVNAGDLRVDAGSGDLTGANVTARLVDLDLGSGGTRLGRVTTRDLKVDAGSGSVDIDFASDVDDVRIDVGSGIVTLRVPPTLGAALDVDTGSGGIETEIPIEVTRRERDHLTGRIGDGKGRIEIDGGSGRVRLLKADR